MKRNLKTFTAFVILPYVASAAEAGNSHLGLVCTIINFLNEKGASGTTNGAELLSKEESVKYQTTI